MDMQRTDTQRTDRGQRHQFTRALLMGALASFTLPFLTVTCYGDDVTISGVQAATTIDLTPQATPDPGDRQFADEHEPPNPFALVALLATLAATGLAFASRRRRSAVTVLAATGALALPGLWYYALQRSSGNAFMDVGMALAIGMLTAAAWAEVGVVPRWVGAVGVGVGAMMVASTLGGAGAVEDLPILVVTYWAGQLVACLLAVGAIVAVIRPPRGGVPQPTAIRLVAASVTGTVCLAAGTVLAFFAPAPFQYGMEGKLFPFVGAASYAVCVALGATIAWILGRAIAHGSRHPAAVERHPVTA